ncbi:tetratricopeptide repeat protein [Sphingomonas sp.]|uniref:tetratricopeptide repeat protein n=1 Tax=Sphingomonas sp. TaxID=28214 RepID=UPI001ED093B1|nr:tetratricopeptide repeat protein [Sphingomonas sp.]MBX3594387.1 tetratricopeptide repeat protein [Sphingomonas sp.]
MRLFALFLPALALVGAGPAGATATQSILAAQRVAVPPRASLASLEAAARACGRANPDTDACFDLSMAWARALLAAGSYREARDVAEAARMTVLKVSDPIDDAYDDAIGRAEFQKKKPEQVDPDFPRIAAQRRRLWDDMSEAHLLRAQAAAAQGDLFDAASGFVAYWSIQTDYVRNPAKAERALAAGLRGAETYMTAGAADQADSVLRFSMPAAQRAFGQDHPTIVAMLLVRARALSAMGKYADAEPMFAEVRARAIRTRDAMLPIDADAAYARHLVAIDRARDALEIQRGVVARLQAANAPPARLAEAYRDFAEVSTGPEAVTIATRALDLYTAAYGADHLLTGRARIAVAAILERQGQRTRAIEERATGIAILSKRLPVLHPEIALAQLRQAESMFMQDRCDEILILAGKALDSFTYVASDSRTPYARGQHPNAARAQFLIGMCELRTKRDSGIARLQKAAEIQRAVLPPTHSERLQTELMLGVIARLQGDYASALRQFRLVAAAGRERVATYTSFDGAAQREQREFAPVYRQLVLTAWTASQPAQKRDPS